MHQPSAAAFLLAGEAAQPVQIGYVEQKVMFASCRSILRNCSISPKKLDLAARLVRRMHIDDALLQMKVKHKKAAKMVHEVGNATRFTAAIHDRPPLSSEFCCWPVTQGLCHQLIKIEQGTDLSEICCCCCHQHPQSAWSVFVKSNAPVVVRRHSQGCLPSKSSLLLSLQCPFKHLPVDCCPAVS